MGILTSILRVAHPVRTVKRSVKRAVIPKPVRKAMRVKNVVVHPVSAVKYEAIGAIDRAITPKPRKRTKRQTYHGIVRASNGAVLWRCNHEHRSEAQAVACGERERKRQETQQRQSTQPARSLSAPQLSQDGRWWWSAGAWHPTSTDRRWFWNGESWQPIARR